MVRPACNSVNWTTHTKLMRQYFHLLFLVLSVLTNAFFPSNTETGIMRQKKGEREMVWCAPGFCKSPGLGCATGSSCAGRTSRRRWSKTKVGREGLYNTKICPKFRNVIDDAWIGQNKMPSGEWLQSEFQKRFAHEDNKKNGKWNLARQATDVNCGCTSAYSNETL